METEKRRRCPKIEKKRKKKTLGTISLPNWTSDDIVAWSKEVKKKKKTSLNAVGGPLWCSRNYEALFHGWAI